MALEWLRRRSSAMDVRPLHDAVVALSRHPALYRDFGVPDTAEGRFESLALHLALVTRRLGRIEPRERAAGVAQALVDHAFGVLDGALREMGVGDLSVPKKIKAMASNYLGRAAAYGAALNTDGGDLGAALVRNILGDDATETARAGLDAWVRGVAAGLDRLALDDILAGRVPADGTRLAA